MVSLPEVFLSRVLLWQIEARAETTYPEECCGLLVGSRSASSITINRAEISPNISGETQGVDTRRSFEVDPCLRLALMRELEGSDDTIIGLYHSHPDHPARPSQHDRDSIWEPELLWLITAVEEGQAGDTTAHIPDLDSHDFHALSLRVMDGKD
jgi:proteasome lid subunit RPN8/RPN11